jgi:hyaluronoglucosaminidase
MYELPENMMDTSSTSSFCTGVIEGFFGHSWSWADRKTHLDFLANQGFSSYIYAPKDSHSLRRNWHEAMPDEELTALRELREVSAQLGIKFGIGITPFRLQENFSHSSREQLLAKIRQLDTLAPDQLSILFDDMPGSLPHLAQIQYEILESIFSISKAEAALCPTYYSSDPILTKLFGAAPEDYLTQLGELLPKEVSIYWTGPKVISSEYPVEHLKSIGKMLQRKPLLWDNYPVNDAKRLVDKLHLTSPVRDTKILKEECCGHFVNPMNQATLSQLPLAGLASNYRGLSSHAGWNLHLGTWPKTLAILLERDLQKFQHLGLERLDDRARLLDEYQACLPHPAAVEVCQWLQGHYAFDESCLT